MAATPKETLKSILDWLAGTDEAGWEQQIELGEECRSEIERMARPVYPRGRPPAAAPFRTGAGNVKVLLDGLKSTS